MSNTDTLLRTPGDRLARARRRAGLTQAELAEKLGIGRRSITRYEDDLAVLRPQTIIAWSHITGAPLEWLQVGVGEASDIPMDTGGHIVRYPSTMGPFTPDPFEPGSVN